MITLPRSASGLRRQTRRTVLIALFLFPASTVFAASVVTNISVDAIAVYGSGGGIFYSFLGHRPAIPQPVDHIEEWRWWTLTGAEPPASPIPNSMPGDNRAPSIAFSRRGIAVVVWSNVRDVGGRLRGDLLFSVWDGTTWSEAAIAVAGAPDTLLQDPSIAIDGSGNGLVVYKKFVVERAPDGSPSGTVGSIEYAKYQDSDGTILAGGTLESIEGPPADAPPAGPEIAFTSTSTLIADSFTDDQAVAAWWAFDSLHLKTCVDPMGNVFISTNATFWVKAAIWNGDSFEQLDFIPDRPSPPPDLSDSLFIIPAPGLGGAKLGVSTDHHGHATVVWGVQKVLGEPCAASGLRGETWSARWNGTEWERKAARLDAQEFLTIGCDVAYLPNHEAVSVYDDFSAGKIKWSTASADGTWTTKGTLSEEMSLRPTIASMAHGETVAMWSSSLDGPGTILWSQIASDAVSTGSWSTVAALAPGDGQADLAAHTGSPTQPAPARWTFMAYQAGDQKEKSLAEYLTFTDRANFEEMENAATKGESSRLNVIALLDREVMGGAAAAETTLKQFVEKQGAEDVRPKPDWLTGNLNTGLGDTLKNFVSTCLELKPASHYFLAISDHGGGWIGTCQDSLSPAGQSSVITLPALTNALAGAITTNRLDLIGFQACLMSQLEVAYQLKDFGQFLVASESVGFGSVLKRKSVWDYETILTDLNTNPHWDDPKRMHMDIVDTIETHIKRTPPNPTTITGVDLSKVSAIATAVVAFADVMLQNLPAQTANVQRAVMQAQLSVAPDTCCNTSLLQDFKDIHDFSDKVKANVPIAAVQSKADDVRRAADDAVYYKDPNGSALNINAHGINLWVPLDGVKLLQNYRKGHRYADLLFNQDFSRWTLFLQAIHKSTTIVVELESADALLFHSVTDPDGDFSGIDPLNLYHLDGEDFIGFCSGIKVGIPGSDYVDYGTIKQVYLPADIGSFRWTIDATDIASASADYVLSIQLWTDDELINEQVFSASIAAGQTMSATFSADDLFIKTVQIDISPGKTPNIIKRTDKGRVAVAILTAAEFNALTVDVASIRFGPGNARAVSLIGKSKDIDKDGDVDLLVEFNILDLGITNEQQLCLTARTTDGKSIKGCDSVTLR